MAVNGLVDWLLVAAEDVVEWVLIPLLTCIVGSFAFVANRIYQNRRDAIDRDNELKKHVESSVEKLQREIAVLSDKLASHKLKTLELVARCVEREELSVQLEKHERRIERIIEK